MRQFSKIITIFFCSIFITLIAFAQSKKQQTPTYRDPLKWPFAIVSIWNMPIHKNAQLAGYTVLIDSLQIIEEKATVSLAKYRQQLDQLRKEFRAVDMPDVKFFLFGMGNRTKLLYKNGQLINSITGKVVAKWQVKNETIIPNDYRVNIETISDVTVSIFENEQGVFIKERGKETIIAGTETAVILPSFEQYKYSEVLKVLHNEILVNIVDSKPLPNICGK